MTYQGSGGARGRRRASLIGLMPVSDHATARAAAKAGAAVGFTIAAIDLGIAVAAPLGYSVLTGHDGHSQTDVAYGVTEIFGLFAVLNAIFAWRVRTGRGWISAILAVVFGVAQVCFVFLIIVNGHGGYGFFTLLLLKFLIDGVRGTWWLRKNRHVPDAALFD